MSHRSQSLFDPIGGDNVMFKKYILAKATL